MSKAGYSKQVTNTTKIREGLELPLWDYLLKNVHAHCFLPTADEVEDSVPRERSQGQYSEDEGQADVVSVPLIIDYPKNPSVDLVSLDDHSWCFLSETSKLASNTASF